MDKRTYKLHVYQTSAIGITGAQSAFYTAPFHITKYDNVGFQFNWTGPSSGPIFIDGSIDHTENFVVGSSGSSGPLVVNPGNFVPLQFNGATATSAGSVPNGSSGVFLASFYGLPYAYVRGRFMNATPVNSSSGNMDIWFMTKEI